MNGNEWIRNPGRGREDEGERQKDRVRAKEGLWRLEGCLACWSVRYLRATVPTWTTVEHGKPTPCAHQAAHPNLKERGLYCDSLPHHQGVVVVMVVVVVVVPDQAFRTCLGEEVYVLRKLGHWQIKEYEFWRQQPPPASGSKEGEGFQEYRVLRVLSWE